MSLSSNEFKLFKQYIYDKCGINIGEEKAYLIETRLSKLLIDSSLASFEELYNAIIKSSDPHVAAKVIDAITTNETLWFRDKTPWAILEEVFMPRFIEELRKGVKNKIRIWSAASSTGQEAYSTAMCIDYYLLKRGINDITLDNFEILATDISKTVIEIARKGRYDAISIMRGMEQIYKDRFFRKNGMVWEISPKINNAVKFEQFNLQNSFLFLGKFDMVFLRYVLIYFSDEFKREVLKKTHECLNENAALFIGASEIYHDMEVNFKMQHYNNGTFYQRRVDKI